MKYSFNETAERRTDGRTRNFNWIKRSTSG